MDTKDQILNRDFSKEFISKMQNAMVMSPYKYGWCSQTYPKVLRNVWIYIRKLITLSIL